MMTVVCDSTNRRSRRFSLERRERMVGYFALVFGFLFIFFSAASFASAARLSLS
jgi:hypothetical protein